MTTYRLKKVLIRTGQHGGAQRCTSTFIPLLGKGSIDTDPIEIELAVTSVDLGTVDAQSRNKVSLNFLGVEVEIRPDEKFGIDVATKKMVIDESGILTVSEV